MSVRTFCAALLLVMLAGRAEGATISLGSFNFDPTHFGDSVIQTPGNSTILAPQRNWFNVVNVDPGVTGALTGPNFNTGLLAAGFAEANPEFIAVRTIGYATPIINRPGPDVGIVLGFEPRVPTFVSVSTDGGQSFLGLDGVPTGAWGNIFPAGDALHAVIASPAIDSGVSMTYYHGDFCQCGPAGMAPRELPLWVQTLDLSGFGIPEGQGVSAVRVLEDDPSFLLLRIAGLEPAAVPEPSGLIVLGGGFLALLYRVMRPRPR